MVDGGRVQQVAVVTCIGSLEKTDRRSGRWLWGGIDGGRFLWEVAA